MNTVYNTRDPLSVIHTETKKCVFVFSADSRLETLNTNGARFLGLQPADAVNRTARELGAEDLLEGPEWQLLARKHSGADRQWVIQRVKADLGVAKRRTLILAESLELLWAGERITPERLIQVLTHEINNSLGPIQSIAATLSRMAANYDLPAPFADDLHSGLELIRERSGSLSRFVRNYASALKLPKPVRRAVEVEDLVADAAALENRVVVDVQGGPKVRVWVDPDQLQQALINLIKNAAEACLRAERSTSSHAVTVHWTFESDKLTICICDEGEGLPEPHFTITPFCTTKPNGSGIGFFLSKQIIELNGGTLTIANRERGKGCKVEVSLPGSCVSRSIGRMDTCEKMFSSGS